jgi:hypothetical protein
MWLNLRTGLTFDLQGLSSGEDATTSVSLSYQCNVSTPASNPQHMVKRIVGFMENICFVPFAFRSQRCSRMGSRYHYNLKPHFGGHMAVKHRWGRTSRRSHNMCWHRICGEGNDRAKVRKYFHEEEKKITFPPFSLHLLALGVWCTGTWRTQADMQRLTHYTHSKTVTHKQGCKHVRGHTSQTCRRAQ